jgi:hypothetical protein
MVSNPCGLSPFRVVRGGSSKSPVSWRHSDLGNQQSQCFLCEDGALLQGELRENASDGRTNVIVLVTAAMIDPIAARNRRAAL